MQYLFTIDLAVLVTLGFVPNKQNKKYHTARVVIGGHTVWCKDYDAAAKLAHRVVGSLYRRGLNVRYRVEDVSGDTSEYNW